MLYFAIAQALLLIYLATMIWSFLRNHREEMPQLNTLGFEPTSDGLLIIVPGKDEAESIGACLEGLMHLNGLANYKVIAVNDRSTDDTEKCMQAVADKNPDRVDVLTIRELPPGWLGKNHACWSGVEHGLKIMPEAKYILFTDGDVKYHPDTLVESITWMKRKKIDFMTMIEEAEYEGVLEPSYLLLFGLFLIFFAARPWLLFKKNGRNFMGNGAYLLATREAYLATEGHKTLRLEVAEDMRMGLLMRSRGYRCAAAMGLGRIRRRWQPGFVGVFKGLLKNAFAGFEYNLGLTLIGILLFPFVILGPWICLLFGYPIVGALGLLTLFLCFMQAGRSSGLPWFTAFLLSPLMCLAASANLATSTFKTLKNNGVSWRNTHYPLQELKAHCLTTRKAFRHSAAP